MKRIALIAAASLALAACGTQARIASPSDSYLACADEPAVPEGDAVTGAVSDQADARYKQELRGAWQDCSSKVQYLHDWFAKLKH
jgi:hypothetical protein